MNPRKLYEHERRLQLMRDAAPELYEALRQYREWAAHFDANVPQEIVAAASAALAKARGDQTCR